MLVANSYILKIHSCAVTESREETTFAFCDYKEEINDNIKGDHSSYLESPSHAKYLHLHGLDLKVASSRLYQENKLTSEGITVSNSPSPCLAYYKN